MSYSKDGKDWLGKERVEHYDDKGNKVGTSKDGKDWLGNERVEHFDDKGNKVGTSKDGKDWLGNERAEHFDDSGKKTGISKSEKDIFGNDIIQHYDNQGNKTKYTKAEKNWLGQTIFRHRSGGGSGDGLYGIIAVIIIIVLIVVAILGTFSYPYKVIDSNISPFHLDWTSNENVWIFCCAFWILLIMSLTNIKKLFQKSADDSQDESSLIKQTIILVLITTTFLMVIQYFIKSRFGESYLLISIILDLLIVGGIFFINKGSKFKFYLLGVSLVISAISLIYINQKTNVLISQNNVESQSIVVNSEKEDLKSSNTLNKKSDIKENNVNSDNDLQNNSNSENYSSNTDIFKDIMVNYYNDLTNDNYDNLLNYYSDTVDRFVNQLTPASKYQIVNSHKGYNYKYPYHKYELIKIEPYGNQYNCYYVEMRISIKKNEIDNLKSYIVKDIFIFDNDNKINNIRILK